jgi:hypothetical protein
MSYISYLVLIFLALLKLYIFWPASPYFPIPQSAYQSPFYFLLLCVQLLKILHIGEIIQQVFFLCLGYFTYHNILQVLYVVVADVRISFFLKGWIIFHIYITHIPVSMSIHPSIHPSNSQLGWFHVLTTVNRDFTLYCDFNYIGYIHKEVIL